MTDRRYAPWCSWAATSAAPPDRVDLVRIMAGTEPPAVADSSYLHNGRLVVASSVTPAQVERWFTEPEVAVEVIAGLRLYTLTATLLDGVLQPERAALIRETVTLIEDNLAE